MQLPLSRFQYSYVGLPMPDTNGTRLLILVLSFIGALENAPLMAIICYVYIGITQKLHISIIEQYNVHVLMVFLDFVLPIKCCRKLKHLICSFPLNLAY